ncbi:MAG: type I 3-dehydroquinate dehydratase [Candidatus Comchoanobacterales bacterium]
MRILCLDHLPQIPLPKDINAYELRMDLINKSLDDIQQWHQLQHCQSILTYRHHEPSSPSRLKYFVDLIQKIQPDWIDCEHDVPLAWVQMIKQQYPNLKVIRSLHTTESINNIDDWVKQLQPLADHVKIVLPIQSAYQALNMMLYIKQHSQVTILGTGCHGRSLRILGPKWGAFDYLGWHQSLHSSQLLLQDRYLNPISTNTRIRALLGNPAHHSLGPFWHGLHHRLTQQDAIYITLEVSSEYVAQLKPLLEILGIHQLSITSPHKQTVASWCNHQGPINTLAFDGQQWLGTNTDQSALNELTQDWPRQRILILGAGSMAQLLAHQLKHNHTCFFNYHREDGITQKQLLMGIPHSNSLNNFDCIINTLPRSVSLDHLSGVIYDVNYHTSGSFGLNLFVIQAQYQQQFWALWS